MSATTATFPSSVLPAPPAFTFQVPEGWVLHEFPNTLGTASVPGTGDGIWINIQVRHERVPLEYTLEDAALSSWARLVLSSPKAAVDMERKGPFGGKECFIRSAFLNMRNSPAPAVQLDALFFAPPVDGCVTRDLIQLVGLIDAPTLLAFTEIFLDATKSFTFTS